MPLADLLFATEEIARAGAEAVPVSGRNTPSSSERIDIKNFDLIPLSMLWSLLSGRDWDSGMLNAFETVFQESSDGPWLYRLPDDLVERILQLSDQRIVETAREWAATEELEDLERRRPGITQAVLSQIVNLCRAAKQAKKGVFLWISL